MAKKIKIAIAVVVAIIVGLIAFLIISSDKSELRTVKSENELSRIYKGDNSATKGIFTMALTMPFSILQYMNYGYNSISYESIDSGGDIPINSSNSSSKKTPQTYSGTADVADSSPLSALSSSSSKEYSTTNIQVENVDEADITKTDGDYIYSISDDNVIITNVKDPQNIKIEAIIKPKSGSVPEDLMLYNDKLVIISTTGNSSSYYSNNNANTYVRIYNIEDKENPEMVKSYELHEPYYTSRCINNELYIISSGRLREDNDKIDRGYIEDNENKEISLNNIKYLKDIKTKVQTIIAVVDLDNVKRDLDISSYLIDISNAYVSENSIYLLDEKYEYGGDEISISKLFGIKGVFGLFENIFTSSSSEKNTEIYKFEVSKDGTVSYDTKTKIEGKTINQYSLDEQNGHLRVALYDNDGARVAIFDENLEPIGVSNYVAKGETMYSSRFMGDKVYLVTYKNMDPLFVIDLSNETKPKVLGELKIPGYSTYLHPYDENHIIGIGMETEEVVNKNSSGKVTSTTAKIVGMKMALFDVSDVNNPEQISQTVIGDRRTTSAILTNPKALLFSKEKELIAIPVNNYEEDFEVDSSDETYSSIVSSYTSYSKSRVAEGYFVYNINIEDGFNLKGVITHEEKNKKNSSYYEYYYYSDSKLLRGMYIDNNLYTVSENAVKVNSLETLDLISELEIK